jgi:predicted DNA binding CopG/RHH family protein
MRNTCSNYVQGVQFMYIEKLEVKGMTDWQRLNVMISAELKEQLKQLAKEKGLDLSAFVRMILTEEAKKK